MTRKQLIEFGILSIAIIMMFKGVETVLAVIVTTMYAFSYGFEGRSTIIIYDIVLIGIYLVVFFIFIKNRSGIANFIDKNTGSSESSNDGQLLINMDQQKLLFIVFIVIAFISLIASVTGIIEYTIEYFSSEVNRKNGGEMSYGEFKADFIKVIIALLIILFARPLAEYFSKRNTKVSPFEFEKQEEQ